MKKCFDKDAVFRSFENPNPQSQVESFAGYLLTMHKLKNTEPPSTFP